MERRNSQKNQERIEKHVEVNKGGRNEIRYKQGEQAHARVTHTLYAELMLGIISDNPILGGQNGYHIGRIFEEQVRNGTYR